MAQQLGLEGPNLFIGAGAKVWSQLSNLARLDLQDGVVSQALLLVVDERGDFCVRGVLLEGRDVPAADSFEALTAGVEVRRLALGATL